MSFISFNFILFLLLFICVYCLSPKQEIRKTVILIANLVFYSFSGYKSFLALIISSLLIYASTLIIGSYVEEYKSRKTQCDNTEQKELLLQYKKKSRPVFIISVSLLVLFLVMVKIFSETGKRFSLFVPLGISYYTFSSIAYITDVYMRKTENAKKYTDFLCAMTFFPVIIQGPIGRYQKIIPQMEALHKPEGEELKNGLWLILLGFFKKLIIADRLALFETEVLGNISSYAGAILLVCVFFDVIKLYADFSACMDIARGISTLLGIKIDDNFRQPFFSQSAAEFWRRWHITLGAWFKEYVYMPLATNPGFIKFIGKVKEKKGSSFAKKVSSAVPLMCVWILTGLWHGTGTDYLLWGIYWGIIIISSSLLTQFFKKQNDFLHIDSKSKLMTTFRIVRTFILFSVGRTFTMAGSLSGMAGIYRTVFGSFANGRFTVSNFGVADTVLAVLGILFILGIDFLKEYKYNTDVILKQNICVRYLAFFTVVLVIAVFGVYGIGYNASDFIYGVY